MFPGNDEPDHHSGEQDRNPSRAVATAESPGSERDRNGQGQVDIDIIDSATVPPQEGTGGTLSFYMVCIKWGIIRQQFSSSSSLN